MNPSLKIGLIGCGRAAELIYLPAIKKFSDVEVIAAVDPIEERRELISKNFKNCNTYSSLKNNLPTGRKDLLEQIDAAIISTPPDNHIISASTLLKNNKFVLVEKPLALSMEGIKELIEIESSSHASLMMGFNHRYWQPVVDLKDKLSVNHKIDFAEIVFTGNYSKWNPVSFKSDPLDDLGPHLFDLIRFIFNKDIKSISAVSTGKNIFQMNVKISSGISIKCHLSHSNKTIKSIKVRSNDETFFITLSSVRIKPQRGNLRSFLDLNDMIKRKLMKKTSPIKKTYEIQLRNFFNLIRLNNQTHPGIKDGIASILAVEATRISISKSGKEIFL
ncbi:MAG: hypothetical protein A2V93_12525 [Ignavibacteria bacterium RBG_16_34_14]|nr:MAG: hypothetical protein A2V93_12525 [Ignavibacteria bacterium RBG_16_34_14]